MPELPEVETVRRGLERILVSQPSIKKFQFLRKDLRDPLPMAPLRQLEGARILGLQRRAKYLLFETEKGGFLSHLGMTGSWRREPGLRLTSPSVSHDHVRIFLSNGDTLIYNDPRRFGVLDVLNARTRQQRLSHLGPEPLEAEFSGAVLWRSLRLRSGSVKAAIMDQKVVVGVGNIYASESLFRSGIRPRTQASKLSMVRANRLVLAIQQVLTSSIDAGGSTISDYRGADGALGSFQNRFVVYGRGGEGCVRCQALIRQAVIAGRSTFWCSHCQK